MKKSVLELITTRGSKTELQLGFRFVCFEALVFANCYVLLDFGNVIKLEFLCWFNFCNGIRKPAVVIIVGVNGGGKTTSLGKT